MSPMSLSRNDGRLLRCAAARLLRCAACAARNAAARLLRCAACPARNVACATLLLAVSSQPLLAEAIKEKRPAPADEAMQDLCIAVRARRILHAHALLSSLNLGVKVQRGHAILWGAVPSQAHLAQAVHLLEELPGIYQVSSEAYLASRDGLSGGLLSLPRRSNPPTQTASASPDPLSGFLPVFRGYGVSPKVDAVTRTRSKSVEKHPSGGHVTLLTPVPVPEVLTSTKDRRKLPPPEGVGAGRGPSLEATLRSLQKRNRGFRKIEIQVQEGVVSLRSRGASGERVMALANQVRKVPGVRRVIIARQER
jgi:osmotically-inducible protein OsmY